MPAEPQSNSRPGLLLGIIILVAMGLASLLFTLISGAASNASNSTAQLQEIQIENIAPDAFDPHPPPSGLATSVHELGESFGSKVGIAIYSLDDKWIAAYRGASLFPQQSVSKLWVAITVLDAVDKGQISLKDQVTVNRSDLTIFNQPIREKLGPSGYRASIEELLKLSMIQSDNTANDILFRKIGGQRAVTEMLFAKEIDEIKVGPGERKLQAGIAGLEWRDEFSNGRSFLTAREALPIKVRQEALKEYLGNPADAATPDGMVRALAKLQEGKLLTPNSTKLLLHLMRSSITGTERLRSGIIPGWTLAHKTGTGQVLGSIATAFNDVGILSAPDGDAYAIAVLISSTDRSINDRQALMAQVTKLVIQCHGKNRSRCN